ncbi:MAG: GIY-YIG nuclease family protein [Cyanobacteria bacterium J06621_11]
MNSWSLYLIRTAQNALYTGITTDVAKRLFEHQSGKKGAKYLRAKGPLRLVYSVELGSRSLASRAEYRIKKLPKAKKETIVARSLCRFELLRLLNIEEGYMEEEYEQIKDQTEKR